MINTNQIVPVTATDLISLYGLILNVGGENVSAVEAASSNGDFSITEASGKLLANQPVNTCDIASGVTTANIYFVPGYDYAGFTINGAAATMAGATVNPDGRTLYLAALASGTITISKVGF